MADGLPRSLDPAALTAALPRFRQYFRYPLHARDFHALRDEADGQLLGYYAAKPLFGTLNAQGRVDRSAGFNGEVMAVFVPSPARSWKRARLVQGRMPCNRVQRADGRRDWPAIRRWRSGQSCGRWAEARDRLWDSALEDRDHAHPARGADRNEATAAAALLQLLRRGGDDACAGGGERMAGCQR